MSALTASIFSHTIATAPLITPERIVKRLFPVQWILVRTREPVTILLIIPVIHAVAIQTTPDTRWF